MGNLSIKLIKGQAWQKLIDEFGHGKIQPRYNYTKDCTHERFPNHVVVRGEWNGSLTYTGFMQDENLKVVAGVDQVPKACRI